MAATTRPAGIDIRPCTSDDIEHLERCGAPWRDMAHHKERWAWQQRGEATYLLAWRDDTVVGGVTLLRRSRYESVNETYPSLWEMNALEARPQGRGVGTLLIAAAEAEALRHGLIWTGLAVEPGNPRAQRLYQRLGYSDWGLGMVVDEWTERDRDGRVIREHHDECRYLVKSHR